MQMVMATSWLGIQMPIQVDTTARVQHLCTLAVPDPCSIASTEYATLNVTEEPWQELGMLTEMDTRTYSLAITPRHLPSSAQLIFTLGPQERSYSLGRRAPAPTSAVGSPRPEM